MLRIMWLVAGERNRPKSFRMHNAQLLCSSLYKLAAARQHRESLFDTANKCERKRLMTLGFSFMPAPLHHLPAISQNVIT